MAAAVPHEKWTIARLQALKGRRKIACLTAYDFFTARLIDEAGLPLILVGDSLAMTFQGHTSTLPVTVENMLYHAAAVRRGVKNALVVADMPFLSYQVSDEDALRNAGRFLKEAGADAVKIEGGLVRAGLVRRLVQNGIPVLAHIGLTPQSILLTGEYRVRGRAAGESAALLRDAQALEKAGAFAVVLECLPEKLGRRITKALRVPTIGIGAGKYCDGQILVVHDMLGMFVGLKPKFVKRYAELGAQMQRAFLAYRGDVEAGRYPGREHSYG